MTIENRLKEERERLGLSQPRFGELAGCVKQTVIQWEKGASAPDAGQLAAIAAAGADVLYILTGSRGGTAAPPALNREEAALLDNYRHCSTEMQQAAKAQLAAMAKPKGVKKNKAA
ncbi:MAG: helix-turn-helix domain-containing protein [Gallionellaceae bacterium]|nr:helix-turn-helix domain-containing protein [Gallionellaceae bacterium]